MTTYIQARTTKSVARVWCEHCGADIDKGTPYVIAHAGTGKPGLGDREDGPVIDRLCEDCAQRDESIVRVLREETA
jgi:NMD protein affecting ribosome stability and mRNA decay